MSINISECIIDDSLLTNKLGGKIQNKKVDFIDNQSNLNTEASIIISGASDDMFNIDIANALSTSFGGGTSNDSFPTPNISLNNDDSHDTKFKEFVLKYGGFDMNSKKEEVPTVSITDVPLLLPSTEVEIKHSNEQPEINLSVPITISGQAKDDKPFFFPKKNEDGKTIESIEYDEEDDDDEDYDDEDDYEDDDDEEADGDDEEADGNDENCMDGGIFLQLANRDQSSIDDLFFFNKDKKTKESVEIDQDFLDIKSNDLVSEKDNLSIQMNTEPTIDITSFQIPDNLSLHLKPTNVVYNASIQIPENESIDLKQLGNSSLQINSLDFGAQPIVPEIGNLPNCFKSIL